MKLPIIYKKQAIPLVTPKLVYLPRSLKVRVTDGYSLVSPINVYYNFFSKPSYSSKQTEILQSPKTRCEHSYRDCPIIPLQMFSTRRLCSLTALYTTWIIKLQKLLPYTTRTLQNNHSPPSTPCTTPHTPPHSQAQLFRPNPHSLVTRPIQI